MNWIPELAAPATKRLRERLDRAGIGWEFGTFPNAQTYLDTVETRTGNRASIAILELEDGTFSMLYAVDELDADGVMFALIEGIEFGGARWGNHGKDED